VVEPTGSPYVTFDLESDEACYAAELVEMLQQAIFTWHEAWG
jgi:hypothetical protein